MADGCGLEMREILQGGVRTAVVSALPFKPAASPFPIPLMATSGA